MLPQFLLSGCIVLKPGLELRLKLSLLVKCHRYRLLILLDHFFKLLNASSTLRLLIVELIDLAIFSIYFSSHSLNCDLMSIL